MRLSRVKSWVLILVKGFKKKSLFYPYFVDEQNAREISMNSLSLFHAPPFAAVSSSNRTAAAAVTGRERHGREEASPFPCSAQQQRCSHPEEGFQIPGLRGEG
jgi:hypothetical protein